MVIVWDLSFNYWFRVGKESNHYFTDLKINLHGIHYLQWDPHVEPAKLVGGEETESESSDSQEEHLLGQWLTF